MRTTQLCLFAMLFVVALSCQKDPWLEDPSKLKDLTKSDFIESSLGGTIELRGGTSIDIPAGALQDDEQISISTFTPTGENIDENDLGAFETTIAFSQIVKLEPSGLTFDKAVQVQVPLVQSWIPDWVTDDMLVGIIVSGELVDSLPVTIDRSTNSVIVETMHFSDLVITMKNNEGISIVNAKIDQNSSSSNLIFDFDIELQDQDGNVLSISDLNFLSPDGNDEHSTYSFFKVSLYQNRILLPDILLTESYLLKSYAYCTEINFPASNNDAVLKTRLETFKNKLGKREFYEVLKIKRGFGTPMDFKAGYVFANYDADGKIMGEKDHNSSISNLFGENAFKFITSFTDEEDESFDLIALSELDPEKEYRLKVNVVIEGAKLGFHGNGDSEKSDKFSLADLGSNIDVTNAPQAVITSPPNNSEFFFGETISFRGSTTDPEDDLDESSYRWYSSIDGELTDYRGKKDFGYSDLSKGTHKITLKVKDHDGMEGEDSLTITITDAENHVPIAKLSVTPTSGKTETEFTFNAGQSTDAEDPLSALKFDWDFDGDMDMEIENTSIYIQKHTYDQPGTYSVWVNVKDTDGKEAQSSVKVTVKKDDEYTPPTASFTLFPGSGTTSTTFQFDASGCSDEETPTSQLQVRWDWENDGSWDTNYSTDKIESHQFSEAGTYTVKVEVKDEEGLTGTITKSVSVTSGGTGGDGEFTYEGRTYEYKTIGTQTWMIENLAYLPSVSDPDDGSEDDPYYYVYGYEGTSVSAAKATDNYETYGVLYNWEAAKTACPPNWHLPSHEEWTVLTDYLGSDPGKKMKSTHGWDWINDGKGDNSSGFNALPGGLRFSDDGHFYDLGYGASFWSSTENGSSNAWYRYLTFFNAGVGLNDRIRSSGSSVRCLMN